MKKTILTVASVLSFLVAPAPAFALFNVNQGGTGQAFFTAGSLLYGNGTNPIATTTPGTLGYVLQFNGTFPTWVATSSLGLVAGNNGEIQFNNNGNFGGDAKLTWDTSGILTVSSMSNRGIRLNSAVGESAIFIGNGTDFSSTYITDNEGALYLQGQTGNNAIEIASADSYFVILDTHLLQSGNRRVTFPNFSGTLGLLEANQTWTGVNTFDQGPVGTTTVNFGHMGSSTSHTCFNTKNTDGQDISFYFVGTSMVVENNACQ